MGTELLHPVFETPANIGVNKFKLTAPGTVQKGDLVGFDSKAEADVVAFTNPTTNQRELEWFEGRGRYFLCLLFTIVIRTDYRQPAPFQYILCRFAVKTFKVYV